MIYWHLLLLSVAIAMASLKYHGIASVFPVWKSSSDLFIKKHFIPYLTRFCSIGSLDNPMLKLQDPQNNQCFCFHVEMKEMQVKYLPIKNSGMAIRKQIFTTQGVLTNVFTSVRNVAAMHRGPCREYVAQKEQLQKLQLPVSEVRMEGKILLSGPLKMPFWQRFPDMLALLITCFPPASRSELPGDQRVRM